MKKRAGTRDLRLGPVVSVGSRLVIGAALVLVLCGCQAVSYSGPNGERFSRRSFAATTSISSLSVQADTNGLRRIELRGYTNDSTQALGAVTEAAVRAAVATAKP